MTVLRGFQKTSQWEANASPFVQAPILGNLRVLSMSEVPHRRLYIRLGASTASDIPALAREACIGQNV